MTTPAPGHPSSKPQHYRAPPGSDRAGHALKAQDYAERRDWPGYFRAVAGKPPRDTLLEALRLFDLEPATQPRLAVDLGCGEGRDTAELLRRGWRVIAIDSHEQALELVKSRNDLTHADRVQLILATFEDARIPTCDLLNSSYALPFCAREAFNDVWRRIVEAIPPGGRFAGQIFGDRDGWATRGDTLHHTREELNHLFRDFVFDRLVEEDRPGEDASQAPKRWHVFHIVARRL